MSRYWNVGVTMFYSPFREMFSSVPCLLERFLKTLFPPLSSSLTVRSDEETVPRGFERRTDVLAVCDDRYGHASTQTWLAASPFTFQFTKRSFSFTSLKLSSLKQDGCENVFS